MHGPGQFGLEASARDDLAHARSNVECRAAHRGCERRIKSSGPAFLFPVAYCSLGVGCSLIRVPISTTSVCNTTTQTRGAAAERSWRQHTRGIHSPISRSSRSSSLRHRPQHPTATATTGQKMGLPPRLPFLPRSRLVAQNIAWYAIANCIASCGDSSRLHVRFVVFMALLLGLHCLYCIIPGMIGVSLCVLIASKAPTLLFFETQPWYILVAGRVGKAASFGPRKRKRVRLLCSISVPCSGRAWSGQAWPRRGGRYTW